MQALGVKKRMFFKYLNGYNEYSDIYLWLCWQIYDLVKIEQNRFLFEDTDDDFLKMTKKYSKKHPTKKEKIKNNL